MKIKLLFFFTLLTSMLGCNSEPVIPINSNVAFLGEYEVESIHISGIQTVYDSVGNIIFQGYDTTVIFDQLIEINKIVNTDTLLINSLIKGFNHNMLEVKGVIVDDTINIVHDFSNPPIKNNYIKGDIWLDGDSIVLNYIWDSSDTWSGEALPVRGMVESTGIKQ